MKRDKALIRKILLLAENSPDGFGRADLKQFESQGYSGEILASHVGLLCEGGLIKGVEVADGTDGLPRLEWTRPARLTWQGFEFLDRLREETGKAARSQSHSQSSLAKSNEPERVLWQSKPAWGYYTGTFILGVVGLFGFVLPGLVILVGIVLDRQNRKYSLTTRRAATTSGIIATKSNEVLLQDIRLVNLNRGFFERVLGLSSIEIGSAGTGQIEVAFLGIQQAQRVRDLIDKHRTGTTPE